MSGIRVERETNEERGREPFAKSTNVSTSGYVVRVQHHADTGYITTSEVSCIGKVSLWSWHHSLSFDLFLAMGSCWRSSDIKYYISNVFFILVERHRPSKMRLARFAARFEGKSSKTDAKDHHLLYVHSFLKCVSETTFTSSTIQLLCDAAVSQFLFLKTETGKRRKMECEAIFSDERGSK